MFAPYGIGCESNRTTNVVQKLVLYCILAPYLAFYLCSPTPSCSNLAGMASNPYRTGAASSPQFNRPAAPLSQGKIAAVNASLILPYYDLGLAVQKELRISITTADNDGFRLVGSHRTTALTHHISNTTKNVSFKVSCKGPRPGVVCPAPSWDKHSGYSWVYPMGTFDGLSIKDMPAVLRRFALPVVQEGDKDVLYAPDNIRTTPPWRCTKVDPQTGRRYTQWFIGIPFCLQDGDRPTTPWIPGLEIPQKTFLTLREQCDRRIEAFFFECQRDPRLLQRFYSELSAAEKVCKGLNCASIIETPFQIRASPPKIHSSTRPGTTFGGFQSGRRF